MHACAALVHEHFKFFANQPNLYCVEIVLTAGPGIVALTDCFMAGRCDRHRKLVLRCMRINTTNVMIKTIT